MRSQAAALVLAFSVGLASVVIHAAELPVEEAVETTSEMLALPTPLGRIAARSCTSCPEKYLELTDATKFVIGEQEVTFTELSKELTGSTRRSVTIYYLAQENSVSRIVLSSAD